MVQKVARIQPHRKTKSKTKMKKTNIIRRLTLAIVCAGAVTSSTNAAISYTETSDFSGNLGSPFAIPGSLGIGANTITGSLPVELGSSDGDVFSVDNSSFLSISSISISISNFIGTTTDPSNGFGLFEILLPNSGSELINGNGFFLLSATINDVSQLQFRLFGPEDFMNMEYGSMDYTVTINAVPEPSSALLTGAFALFALAARTLRRRKNI